MQDEAGRELLALVARLNTQTGAALVSYLGLFRSASRDLANERALKLARETLGMTTDTARLAIALSETVEALRGKQPRQRLKNHNYLSTVQRVLTGPGKGRLNTRPRLLEFGLLRAGETLRPGLPGRSFQTHSWVNVCQNISSASAG